jgi:hypothetical protein
VGAILNSLQKSGNFLRKKTFIANDEDDQGSQVSLYDLQIEELNEEDAAKMTD